MKYDNPKIKQGVIKILKSNYNLSITSLKFIPVGEESYCYLVVDKNQNKFFAKFCESLSVVKNIDLVNKLLLQLKHLNFVVPPVEVSGKTSFPFLGGKVYVYPYVEGRVVNISNTRFDQKLVLRLLDIMVKIHSSTDKITVNLPRENFDNNFRAEIEQLVKRSQSNNISPEIKSLLETNLNLIREIIKKHTLLGKKYKEEKLDFVLTHGDITGLNIIISDDNLKLTDWDGVMFAPAERDINFFFDNPHFSIDAYLKKMNKNHYEPRLIEYYGQQWALGSIIGNFNKLISSEMNESDKAECIEEISEYLDYFK